MRLGWELGGAREVAGLGFCSSWFGGCVSVVKGIDLGMLRSWVVSGGDVKDWGAREAGKVECGAVFV